MTVNGSEPGISTKWTAPAIVCILTLIMVFVWDRINVGSRLDDCTIKIQLLRADIDRLGGIRDTQIKDEGTILSNTRDIDDLKKRLDAIHAVR
jgi:hypothetical protein